MKKNISIRFMIILVLLVLLPCVVFFVGQVCGVWSGTDGLLGLNANGKSGRSGKGGQAENVTPKKRTDDGTITVYMSKKKKYETFTIRDYITGVLCAEVPSTFDEEALKAQAIVSRTYAFARNRGHYSNRAREAHAEAPVCDSYQHCQAFITKAALVKSSGDFGKKKWNSMIKAVNSTKNTILMYQGKIANPLFHACSGGVTESATDVWGGAGEDYLQPVLSPGEEQFDAFEQTVEIGVEEYTKAMDELKARLEGRTPSPNTDSMAKAANNKVVGKNVNPFEIRITQSSDYGRVRTAEYRGCEMTGVEIRTALGLRSTIFTIDMSKVANKGVICVTTKGFGHGIGMSQYGAEAMAKNGSSCEEILHHYYTGIEVTKIGNIKK